MLYNLMAPYVETDRLIIRLVSLEDDYDYYEMCCDEDVCRYLTFNPYTSIFQMRRSIENMLYAYNRGTDVNLSIVLKDSNKVIGSVSLTFKFDTDTAELGYLLNKRYWGNGYMFEAISAMKKIAFDYYKVSILKAIYIQGNEKSAKILKKSGFIFDNIKKHGIIKNSVSYDCVTVYMTCFSSF